MPSSRTGESRYLKVGLFEICACNVFGVGIAHAGRIACKALLKKKSKFHDLKISELSQRDDEIQRVSEERAPSISRRERMCVCMLCVCVCVCVYVVCVCVLCVRGLCFTIEKGRKNAEESE